MRRKPSCWNSQVGGHARQRLRILALNENRPTSRVLSRKRCPVKREDQDDALGLQRKRSTRFIPGVPAGIRPRRR